VAFFESGRAELTEEMQGQMDQLAPVLKKLADKFDIVVEGHTDNVPIFTRQFASNWELSTARATNVVMYLLDRKGFPPKRMAAVGYGEYHPIVPNDTEQNRKRNRRVVFFVKNNPYPDVKAEPAKPGAAKITVSEGAGVEGVPAAAPGAEEAESAGAQAPPAGQEPESAEGE